MVMDFSKCSKDKKTEKYWSIIHWDVTAFVSNHDGYNSKVFNDKIHPTIFEDVKLLIRNVFGGIIRFIQKLIQAALTYSRNRVFEKYKYCLVITVGGAKYASEEREITDSLKKNGFNVLIVNSGDGIRNSTTGTFLSTNSYLTVANYVWAMVNWFINVIWGFHNVFSCDKKKRSLFVASISSIREYFITTALAKRIIAAHGIPLAIYSLCPSSQRSVAIVKYMKKNGVLTAGIRTQSTASMLEHIAINTEILFCKSINEKLVYEKIFLGRGPALVEGCLMSIPEIYHIEPLVLPEKYVLVIGTAKGFEQSQSDYDNLNERILAIAAKTKLPIIFKGHNLSKELDDKWFAENYDNGRIYLRITDVEYNRQLIDNADLVVSFYSTLLYYAILQNRPIILVEKKTRLKDNISDEFQLSPINRIRFDQAIENVSVDLSKLNTSAYNLKHWFTSNYFLEKGADYIITYLMNVSAQARV